VNRGCELLCTLGATKTNHMDTINWICLLKALGCVLVGFGIAAVAIGAFAYVVVWLEEFLEQHFPQLARIMGRIVLVGVILSYLVISVAVMYSKNC
jgi:predicted PurR-regulated permease PerM